MVRRDLEASLRACDNGAVGSNTGGEEGAGRLFETQPVHSQPFVELAGVEETLWLAGRCVSRSSRFDWIAGLRQSF
jgi:hypothetical protein